MYLSAGRFSSPADKARYRLELDAVSNAVQSGETLVFAPAELARLKAELTTLKSGKPSAAWAAVLRLFLPAAMFIGLLLALAYVIRTLKHA